MHESEDHLGMPPGSALSLSPPVVPVVSPHDSADERIPQKGHRTEARPRLRRPASLCGFLHTPEV